MKYFVAFLGALLGAAIFSFIGDAKWLTWLGSAIGCFAAVHAVGFVRHMLSEDPSTIGAILQLLNTVCISGGILFSGFLGFRGTATIPSIGVCTVTLMCGYFAARLHLLRSTWVREGFRGAISLFLIQIIPHSIISTISFFAGKGLSALFS